MVVVSAGEIETRHGANTNQSRYNRETKRMIPKEDVDCPLQMRFNGNSAVSSASFHWVFARQLRFGGEINRWFGLAGTITRKIQTR